MVRAAMELQQPLLFLVRRLVRQHGQWFVLATMRLFEERVVVGGHDLLDREIGQESMRQAVQLALQERRYFLLQALWRSEAELHCDQASSGLRVSERHESLGSVGVGTRTNTRLIEEAHPLELSQLGAGQTSLLRLIWLIQWIRFDSIELMAL